MSLFALPVTVSDVTTLQSGIQFFTNTAEANSEVASINANQPTDSVFIYATKLLANNISLSQVAMSVSALMEGGTIAVGNATTPNTLTLLSTVFLPGQVAVALANGFNPTVFAAESLGSALSTNAAFNTNFVGLSVSAFSQAVSTLTGVNVNAIQQFVTNWQAFFTANPSALQGRTVTQASYGAAFGDADGVALLNATSANLQTVVSTSLGQTPVQFSPNTIKGLVANALFDVATGQYQTGVALGGLPAHTPVQGEFNQLANGVFLTQGVDTPTSGFATDANGTPKVPAGFTATTANTVLNALPFVTATGAGNNTLNTGDNLQTTGAATGATKLVDVTSNNTFAANAPFATAVTMNGVNALDITASTPGAGPGGAGVGGFRGDITGLLVENNLNSVGFVTLGGTGQGLKTLLTDINISGNGSNAVAGVGNFVNTVVLAGAGDATKTINIGLTGTLGATAANAAARLSISNDVGGGTAAAPNLTYGTWSITAANTSNLQLNPAVTTNGTGDVLTQGGVGGAKTLALAGAGMIAVGQAVAGNWQLLTTVDMSKGTGTEFVTGSTSGVASQARASAGNPGWLFGSTVGLLNEGAGGTFGLTSVLLGSGNTIVDVSAASAAQVAALTTAAGTGVTVNPANEIIVKNSVATSPLAATFAKIGGFSDLGIGGPAAADGAGGIINLQLLPTSINTLSYITASSAALTVNNQVNPLTINTFDNGGGNAITVGAVGPAAGLKDSFRLIVGDTFHSTVGAVGNVTLNGDEVVTLSSVGGAAAVGANTIGFVSVRPTIGGLVDVTIDGTNDLTVGVTGTGAIAAQDAGGALLVNALSITITDPGVVRFHSTVGGAAVLDLKVPGDPANGSGGAFPLTNSTNARLIDASASGGLIMEGGDANFVSSATVAGSLGDVLIGSKTGGNVLGGSIGNDIFTSNVSLVADTIFTSGGADKINLTLGHTASNSLDMYSGFSTAGVTPGTAEIVRFASITNANDIPSLGWFGQPTGAIATGYNAAGTTYAGLAAGTGVAAANSTATTITNFNPGGATPDILQLSDSTSGYGVGAIGANGAGGVTIQLVNGGLAQFTAAGVNGTAVNVQQVNPGNALNAAANFFELTTGTFLTQSAVASALDTFYGLTFAAALGNNNSAHIYVAYSDGTNAHVSDVAFINKTGAATNSLAAMNIFVSDIAVLANTPLTALDGTNVHVMHG